MKVSVTNNNNTFPFLRSLISVGHTGDLGAQMVQQPAATLGNASIGVLADQDVSDHDGEHEETTEHGLVIASASPHEDTAAILQTS